MEVLPVHFRNTVYKLNYSGETINWIDVYVFFVENPYLKELVGDYFHILHVTTELQNVYWYGSKKGSRKEANEFKQTVAATLKALHAGTAL